MSGPLNGTGGHVPPVQPPQFPTPSSNGKLKTEAPPPLTHWPAFPVTTHMTDGGKLAAAPDPRLGTWGMTLLEHFAGQILGPKLLCGKTVNQAVAKEVFDFAQALVDEAARRRTLPEKAVTHG